MFPIALYQYVFPLKHQSRPAPHLALSRRDGFGVVAAVEAVNAALEFLSDQGFIFPAALRVGQAHPFAQIFGFIRRCRLPTVSCFTDKNVQVSHCPLQEGTDILCYW